MPTGLQTFDTIIVPAREDGFQSVFLGKRCWHAVRIHESKLAELKFVVAYRVAPLGEITHCAEILEIVPYLATRKYEIRFKGLPRAIGPILRTSSIPSMQTARYALMTNILRARTLEEIWPAD